MANACYARAPTISLPYRSTILEHEVVIKLFRSGGPGGQHRNVTDSAVRLHHLPSGIQVTVSGSRSQHRNRETAFARLITRLKQLNQVRQPRVSTRTSPWASNIGSKERSNDRKSNKHVAGSKIKIISGVRKSLNRFKDLQYPRLYSHRWTDFLQTIPCYVKLVRLFFFCHLSRCVARMKVQADQFISSRQTSALEEPKSSCYSHRVFRFHTCGRNNKVSLSFHI